jgi:hypothetical protein
MRVLLQLLAAMFGPDRAIAARRNPSREDYLKALVILAIALLAGPDILAAIELTTLLELFGAAMFVLSFAVGLRLLGFAVLEKSQSFLLPVEYVALTRTRGCLSARLHGVLLLCRHNLRPCCLVLVVTVVLIQLVR